MNIAASLHNQFRGRPCKVYANDMRIKVSPTGLYTYPDIVAVCEEAQLEDEHLDTLLNPTVLIEVLSRSTEAYDRGEKAEHYRRLPSLAAYLLVSQDKPHLEPLISGSRTTAGCCPRSALGRRLLPSRQLTARSPWLRSNDRVFSEPPA